MVNIVQNHTRLDWPDRCPTLGPYRYQKQSQAEAQRPGGGYVTHLALLTSAAPQTSCLGSARSRTATRPSSWRSRSRTWDAR